MVLNCRNWPETQWTPSFKGVAFEVTDEGREAGRRLVVHEYPSREVWDVEDLGKRSETIEINGYLAGDNADLQSQRILQAFASPEAGLLILPNRPPVMARCLTVRSSWNADELGRMSFTASMTVEARSVGGMVSVGMLASAVFGAATDAIVAVSDLFAVNFNTVMRRFSPLSMVPGVARDAAAVTIRQAAEQMRLLAANVPIRDRDAKADISYAIRQMIQNAALFAYVGQRGDRITPLVFVRDQFRALNPEFQKFWGATCKLILQHCEDWEQLERAAVLLSGFQRQVTTSGPQCRSVVAERDLAEEVAVYVRRTALLMQAVAAARTIRSSREKAVEARTAISKAFAVEMAAIADPKTYAAFGHTRDRALDLIARRGAQLPKTVILSVKGLAPAAVIVAQLYEKVAEDADRELVERNLSPHPLFLGPEVEALAGKEKRTDRNVLTRAA